MIIGIFLVIVPWLLIIMSKLLVILGPTASGKTALAHHLAGVFGGEIVNADSRQIYKGLAIATAKPNFSKAKKFPVSKLCLRSTPPTAESQFPINSQFPIYHVGGIPYYLFDVINPDQEFSVAKFKKLAIKTIKDIQAREKLPLLVGGTGLYIKAIVDNLQIPEVPAQKKLRQDLEGKSEEELFAMLKAIDPEGANIIDKKNKRRLIRALEVNIATGKPFSRELKRGPQLFQTLQLGIDIPKEELFKHIASRTQQMIDEGLEQEIKTLIEQYGWNNLLQSTIGYKEWQGFFEKQKTLEQIKDEIIKNTKALVKKQLTWFRAQKGIHWVKSEKEAQDIIAQFLKK